MTEIGTRARTVEEENQIISEVGVHLQRVSQLILASVETDQWCLLDWPQIDSYVKEQMKLAMEVYKETPVPIFSEQIKGWKGVRE